MEILTVEPRTDAWHAIRAETWTASLAATLCSRPNAELLRLVAKAEGVELDIQPLLDVGMNSFFENTLWRVWAQKMGYIPKFEGNDHTARGQRYEELVIQSFEKKHLFKVEREVTALSSEYAGFLASFDAIAPQSTDTSILAPNGYPVEAKCPAFPTRKKMWDSRKEGKLAVMATPYYWCQVQHQMLVADAPYAWFIAAGVEHVLPNPKFGAPDEPEFIEAKEDDPAAITRTCFPIYEKIDRDVRFLKAYDAAARFYHQHFLVQFNEPPKLPEDWEYERQLILDAELAKAGATGNDTLIADAYLEALEAVEKAKAELERIQKRVEEAAMRVMDADGEEVAILANRLEITKSTTGGGVQWQKVANQLAKDAGMTEIPTDVTDKFKTRSSTKLKIKEVVV